MERAPFRIRLLTYEAESVGRFRSANAGLFAEERRSGKRDLPANPMPGPWLLGILERTTGCLLFEVPIVGPPPAVSFALVAVATDLNCRD